MAAYEIATRLMVFLSEDDRAGHRSLPEVILDRARQEGLAGATIWRGIEGFGASGQIRTARFPDSCSGLPVVLELIDLPDRIEAFIPVLRTLAAGSLITREQVQLSRPARRP
jgi:PII-like signaling protein